MVEMSKASDKFRMEEGYSVEQVTVMIKAAQESLMQRFEEQIRAASQETGAAVPGATPLI